MTGDFRNDATAANLPVMRTAVARGNVLLVEDGRRQLPVWSKTYMRTIAEFTNTTLIGEFLIVLPVYVSLLLLGKALQSLMAAVKPITAAIPASVEFDETWRSWCLPRFVLLPV